MERSAYNEMRALQHSHWWFKARRKVIGSYLSYVVNSTKVDKILEIGCGSGGNIALLQQYAHVEAVEMDDESRSYSISSNNINIQAGNLPHNIPFKKSSHDLICMFDVLEHIENDQESLEGVYEQLPNNGTLLLTVPAYQWLFSQHDKTHHHFRRYSKSELNKKLQSAGFEIEKISYFNMLLFPLAIISRLSDRILKNKGSAGTNLPHPALNSIFYQVFTQEAKLTPRISLPFGLSLIAIAKKRHSR